MGKLRREEKGRKGEGWEKSLSGWGKEKVRRRGGELGKVKERGKREKERGVGRKSFEVGDFLLTTTPAETVFYTMSVYFMSVGISKSRYTLAAALLANMAGIAAAFFVTRALFGA